jgi:hypothetical protein
MEGKEQTVSELANDKWIGLSHSFGQNNLTLIKPQSKGTVLCGVFCNAEEGL